MKRRMDNIMMVLLVAILWVPLSLSVTVILASTEDPPNPATAPDPWLLRVIYSIVTFPAQTFEPWNWIYAHLSQQNAVGLAIAGMFLNGLLWGGLLVVVWRYVFPLLRQRMRGGVNAA
jgi:hypothetical protein